MQEMRLEIQVDTVKDGHQVLQMDFYNMVDLLAMISVYLSVDCLVEQSVCIEDVRQVECLVDNQASQTEVDSVGQSDFEKMVAELVLLQEIYLVDLLAVLLVDVLEVGQVAWSVAQLVEMSENAHQEFLKDNYWDSYEVVKKEHWLDGEQMAVSLAFYLAQMMAYEQVAMTVYKMVDVQEYAMDVSLDI